MKFSLEISNIQHLSKLCFSLDLSENKITCIVGKNGTGKTTLVKAIRNLVNSDTFVKTSSKMIFSEKSSVRYVIDEQVYEFLYDPDTQIIDAKTPVDNVLKTLIDAELPIPYGERFNFFQALYSLDDQIRQAITLEQYTEPRELREFLHKIYNSTKFNTLVQINIKDEFYYCIPLENNKYIREDYLSSGEYFLISLYKKITKRKKLIIVDEIDISLDAAAQVRLIDALRAYSKQYNVNIVFTTHSLALMRMLRPEDALYYIEELNGSVQIEQRNYNYIASVLFGFTGRDKYIITEDSLLKSFIKYFLRKYCDYIQCLYQIVHLNGAPQVFKLLQQNKLDKFFSNQENVIAILDRDQINEDYLKGEQNIYFIPFKSVEKRLLELFNMNDPDFPKIKDQNFKPHSDKKLYNKLQNEEALAK